MKEGPSQNSLNQEDMATPASPTSAQPSADSLCAASREEMEPSKLMGAKGMLEIKSGSREQDCRAQAEYS